MKRILTIILCTLAGLVGHNGAVAQQQHAVRVVIPFDFTASGTQLPAGAYTIATQNSLTLITENSTGKSAFVSSIPVIVNLPGDTKLIFSTYGDQHFLRKILCPGLDMNLEFLPSKSETRARVQTAMQTASNSGR